MCPLAEILTKTRPIEGLFPACSAENKAVSAAPIAFATDNAEEEEPADGTFFLDTEDVETVAFDDSKEEKAVAVEGVAVVEEEEEETSGTAPGVEPCGAIAEGEAAPSAFFFAASRESRAPAAIMAIFEKRYVALSCLSSFGMRDSLARRTWKTSSLRML